MMESPRCARRRGGAGRGTAATALVATSAALALGLAGIAGNGSARADDWPTYRGNVQHTGVTAEKVQPPLSLLWRYTAGSQPATANSPVAVGDTVYYTARGVQQGGVLYALDVKTGALKWQSPELLNHNVFSTSPTIDGGKVYIGSSEGKVYVYDAASGREVTEFNAGRSVNSAPVINEGTLYFGANDGTFRAINPETGASIWRQTLKADDGINSAPIFAGNLLFFTTNNNSLYAVNTATGIKKWSYRIDFKFGPNAPLYADNTLYIGSGPRLYAFLPTSGNVRWTRDLPSDVAFSPVSADGIVYVVAADKHVYAIRSNGRTDVWKHAGTIPFAAAAAPIVSGDAIYIPTNQSTLVALSREDGHLLWQYRIDGSAASPNVAPPATTILSAPVAVANGTLYAVSSDGALSAFRPDAVDTTGPLASNLYPPPGLAVNGSPGLIMAASVSDPGSGLDPSSVTLSLDGKKVDALYDVSSNIVYYRTKATGKLVDPPLSNGRHTLTLTASDFKGNPLNREWSFLVDNSVPQYRPGTPTSTGNPGGQPGGGRGRGPGGFPGAGRPGGFGGGARGPEGP